MSTLGVARHVDATRLVRRVLSRVGAGVEPVAIGTSRERLEREDSTDRCRTRDSQTDSSHQGRRGRSVDQGRAAIARISEGPLQSRALFEAILLEPDGDELKITLKGDLAGMLGAARDSKRSPETGDLLVQIKLVAGAGFEPATFGL
jgi:hypothetical protein